MGEVWGAPSHQMLLPPMGRAPYFLRNGSPSKTVKDVLFNLRSFFCSRDIQIFVFLSSLLFLPVSNCFRGCSKINLKIYDDINFLSLIRIHFMEEWIVTAKHRVTRKINTKTLRLLHTENLFRKQYAVTRCLLILDLSHLDHRLKERIL